VSIEIPAGPQGGAAAKTRAESGRRHAQGNSYIPTCPGANSPCNASVSVDGTVALNHVAVGATYTLTTNVGSHLFAMTYYDKTNTALSTGSTTASIISGTNNVSILLGGIPKTLTFTTLPAVTIGTAIANAPVVVGVADADGSAITGSAPFSTPITVSISSPGYNGPGGTQLLLSVNAGAGGASQLVTKPTDALTLNYNPLTGGGQQLSSCLFATASATGLTTLVSPSLVGAAATTTALAPTIGTSGFAHDVVSWTANAAAAGGYRLYRGVLPGQENTLVSSGTATTQNDYTATFGTNYYYRVSYVDATGKEHCDNSAEPTGTPTSDPTQLGGGNILVWYDSADNTTITSANAAHHDVIQSGDAVFNWGDKSGQGYNATASGAAQPTYSTAKINTLPAMVGAGSQYWTIPGNPSTDGSYSVFTIASLTSSAAASTLYDSFHRAPSLTISPGPVAQPDGLTGATLTAASPVIFSHIGTGTGAPPTSTASSLYINGTPAVTGTITNNVLPAGFLPTGSTALTLWYFQTPIGTPPNGSMGFSQSQYFTGSMGEFVAYSSPLSTNDQVTMEGYLACKWGEQALLPAGHKYKTACP
jgi:hypothetical protein